MSYVITEYDLLMKQRMQREGLFYNMMNDIETKALFPHKDPKTGLTVAGDVEQFWGGLTYGGFTPGAKQFGRTTILPPLFDGTAATQLATYWQNYTSSGNVIILQGVRTGEIIPEDWYIVWVGLAFTSKMNYFTEIRWQIGDTVFPRLNMEELDSYNKPAIIFENGYQISEETYFQLRGYLRSLAPNEMGVQERQQRIVPLGFACYKRKDAAIRSPGAAI